jgi:ATP-binding cassette subfamily F protein 3
MDEPTNHLDLYSKKALEKALKDYDGTLLLISHDRYFLDQLVTIVFELRDGTLSRCEGNYSSYLNKKRTDAETEETINDDQKQVVRKDKSQKRLEAEARQKVSQRRKQLNNRIEKLEFELEQLETEKDEIESKLAEPDFYKNQQQAAEIGKRYQQLQDAIPKLYDEWEKCQKELESLLAGLKN